MNWSYVFGAYASLFFLGMMDNSRGPLYPEILEMFSLDESQGAYFFFITSAMGLCSNLLAGVWLTWMRPLQALRFFLLCQASGFVAIGLSAAMRHWWGLLFGGAIFGVGLGGIGILVNILVYRGVPSSKRRQYLSGLHSMYGMASLIAPLIVAFFVRQDWPWFHVFTGLALFPLLLALYSYSWERASGKTDLSKRKLWVGHGWQIGAALGFYVAAEILVSSRLVLFNQKVIGLGVEKSSLYLSLFFALLLFGRLAFSVRNWKVSHIRALNLSSILTVICLVVGMEFHPLFLSLSGLAMSVFFPATMALIADEFPDLSDSISSQALLFVNTILVVMHWGVGALSGWLGLARAFWLAPTFIFLSLLMVLWHHFRRV